MEKLIDLICEYWVQGLKLGIWSAISLKVIHVSTSAVGKVLGRWAKLELHAAEERIVKRVMEIIEEKLKEKKQNDPIFN